MLDSKKRKKNKKIRVKKWHDKVVRSKIKGYYVLIGDYNKYYEMMDSFNLIETKNKIKNKLYEIIFKGTILWKSFGGNYGFFILLIIIRVIVDTLHVVCL
ncbi:hypothetical protein PFMALIP_02287 [Plasmodium falciparum MaliPS096_E11]|uniref:Uncharacterized protein n=1 Tax=Plasmodium falciparum MaliPS096_E11 TaxID=1036727 RepID=A0A024WRZ6_PLAFA|nr:hypothetical protein PFMALIP_02287 [Plasmodium falciparum MaliPS096_E11]